MATSANNGFIRHFPRIFFRMNGNSVASAIHLRLIAIDPFWQDGCDGNNDRGQRRRRLICDCLLTFYRRRAASRRAARGRRRGQSSRKAQKAAHVRVSIYAYITCINISHPEGISIMEYEGGAKGWRRSDADAGVHLRQ